MLKTRYGTSRDTAAAVVAVGRSLECHCPPAHPPGNMGIIKRVVATDYFKTEFPRYYHYVQVSISFKKKIWKIK